ncbi:MAG: TonB-dependent receptor domain-containing protein [Parahaliea sp.]
MSPKTHRRVASTACALSGLALFSGALKAETYELKLIRVGAQLISPSQATRAEVEDAAEDSRSSSTIGGTEIQNLNPLNTGDALRFGATGLIGAPYSADRFGGSAGIRTFGDWGASTSIDGLPAIKFAGEEGGGYSNARIPTIAIDRISVLRGGRAVQYGNGSDGGVFQTMIKDGRGYNDHFAGSLDYNDASEGVLQAEFADSTDNWDIYIAGRYFDGAYDGEPASLDDQSIGGGVLKYGFNISPKTRLEVLGMLNRSDTDIYRGDAINNIDSDTQFGSVTLEHAFSDNTSVRAGYLRSDTDTQWPARSRDRATIIDIAFADIYLTRSLSDTLSYAGSVGVEYKHTKTLRDNSWENTFDDSALKNVNTLRFRDNLALTLGLRYTDFDNKIVLDGVTRPDNLRTSDITSWDIGAAYSVLPDTRLRASAATGYNRFYEKYGNFGTDALNPVGAEDTIVESTTYEIGIRQDWQDGYVDLALYEVTQEDVPRREGGAIESVEVEQSGLELEAFVRLSSRMVVSAGYMHIFDLEATRADGTKSNGNIFWGSNGVNVPTDQFTVRADFMVNETLSLWGAGLYNEGFEQTPATGETVELRAYERIDVGASWQVSNSIGLRFRVENVTNEKDFGQTLEGATVNTTGKLGTVYWAGIDFVL